MKHTPIHNLGANFMTLWNPLMDILACKYFEWKMDGYGWIFKTIDEKMMMDELHPWLCFQWSSHMLILKLI
jgi:hypothetical protein